HRCLLPDAVAWGSHAGLVLLECAFTTDAHAIGCRGSYLTQGPKRDAAASTRRVQHAENFIAQSAGVQQPEPAAGGGRSRACCRAIDVFEWGLDGLGPGVGSPYRAKRRWLDQPGRSAADPQTRR